MRPPHSSLPARDACRALAQHHRQLRSLSSAALIASGTASAPTSNAFASSSSLPFTFSFSAASSSNSRSARSARPSFASAYSTSNPAYPLPGSNNEIDPRGVDFSLFESEDESYAQHALSAASAKDEAAESSPAHATSSSAGREPAAALSAPTQLLARLMEEEDFETATIVLHELQDLNTSFEEPLPVFANAALWAIRNGKKKDMLAWMGLCPGFKPGTKFLETASSIAYTKQVKLMSLNFRKCFMVLLDSHGDDLRLLQRASTIAAEKGLWGVIHSTLAQILRYGAGCMRDSDDTRQGQAWQYFNRLVLVHHAHRGTKEARTRRGIQAADAASTELHQLYNLGIRTLALAGRLEDAVTWAMRSISSENSANQNAHIISMDSFTQNLLLEELVRAGDEGVDQAHLLAHLLASASSDTTTYAPVDVAAIAQRIARESAFSSEADGADTGTNQEATLDGLMQAHLDRGDVLAARECLLSVLRTAKKVRRNEDIALPASDDSGARMFAHLPSARVLSELQDMANKLGTVAVTISLTESDTAPLDGSRASDASWSQETVTADEFLRPIRSRLLTVRGGRGLWETARLYGFVKKSKWRDALDFYIGKSGFKMPSGGITNDLVALALDQPSAPTPGRREKETGSGRAIGKHWPSTHAINLVLRAVVGVCMEAKDYSRLTRAYTLWRETSSPRQSNEGDPEADDGESMVFEQWPPSQRPDSRTFDGFIRAFGRLEIDVPVSNAAGQRSHGGPDGGVEKQSWGSSKAVLDVIRDMTETFLVQPSVSSWTIALECLAREGRARWATTTSVLARAVGIQTISPLTDPCGEDADVVQAQANFAPANMVTYTALIRALIRVSHRHGGSIVEQAAAVRDDLLARTLDLDLIVRPLARADKDGGAEADMFWSDLLDRWEAVQQAILPHAAEDRRTRWHADKLLKANQGRTLEALRELWLIESATETTSAHTPGGRTGLQ